MLESNQKLKRDVEQKIIEAELSFFDTDVIRDSSFAHSKCFIFQKMFINKVIKYHNKKDEFLITVILCTFLSVRKVP